MEFLYKMDKEIIAREKEILLLKEPEEGYYKFKADPDLVIKQDDLQVAKVRHKSFHADTYCFDSKPEKELFLQYIKNDKVKEVYFTGMFTSNQSEFSIQYIDPESKRLRRYYPDLLAKFEDGTYEIIEVKADNQIDDAVVKAKQEAALEMATESKMKYTMYKASIIMKTNVLEGKRNFEQEKIED